MKIKNMLLKRLRKSWKVMINLINYTTVINGGRCFLAILQKEHASQEYCNWLNDEVVNKYLETRQATVADLEKYITEKLESGNCLFFGIFWKENNKHIGNIKLEPIDFKEKSADLGIMIGDKDFWGKGIGVEVVNLITDFVFNTLKLDEINLGVISENKQAIRVYEKCGFKVFNISKDSIKHGDVLYNQIWMKKTRL